MNNKTNKARSGTSNFINRESAIQYYHSTECFYGYPAGAGRKEAIKIVNRKLAEGTIFLGKPQLKSGQKLFVNREEGRYFIGE